MVRAKPPDSPEGPRHEGNNRFKDDEPKGAPLAGPSSGDRPQLAAASSRPPAAHHREAAPTAGGKATAPWPAGDFLGVLRQIQEQQIRYQQRQQHQQEVLAALMKQLVAPGTSPGPQPRPRETASPPPLTATQPGRPPLQVGDPGRAYPGQPTARPHPPGLEQQIPPAPPAAPRVGAWPGQHFLPAPRPGGRPGQSAETGYTARPPGPSGRPGFPIISPPHQNQQPKAPQVPEPGNRWQGSSEDINRGLGVAPKEGVDTGPQDRRNLINRGLGVAPKEGVDTGPHDGGDIFNSNSFKRGVGTAHRGVGTAPRGIEGISNHGREGDRCRDGRMAGRESVGTERPAAAARGLGSAWHKLQTRRPSPGQQPPNAAATRR